MAFHGGESSSKEWQEKPRCDCQVKKNCLSAKRLKLLKCVGDVFSLA